MSQILLTQNIHTSKIVLGIWIDEHLIGKRGKEEGVERIAEGDRSRYRILKYLEKQIDLLLLAC